MSINKTVQIYDVCMMTSYHRFDDSRIFHKEIKSLVNAGYKVISFAPAEKNEFEVDGIKIIGFKRRRKLGRIVTAFLMAREAIKYRAKVYHFHEPELLIAAVIIKMLIKCALIYDVHEEHSTSIPMEIKSRTIQKRVGDIIMIIEKLLTKYVDRVIVVREDLIERFSSYGCSKIDLVMVCPSKRQFVNFHKRKDILSAPITIVHEGNLDIKTRGLDKYLYAAKEVLKMFPEVHFLTIGRAPKKDVEWMNIFIKENCLEKNFIFTGWVDFEKIPEYLYNSDLGILILRPVSKNNILGIPNKLFDYMAAGIPIVSSNFPNISNIIKESNCGLLVDSNSYSEIAKAIISILEDKELANKLGENARKYFELKYNWEIMSDRLLSIYRDIISV